MATQDKLNAVADRAYEAFENDARGWNLDMASFPTMQSRRDKKQDETFLDPRFAPLSNDRPLKLRRALTNFANENSRDREVAEVLKQGGVIDGSEGRTGVCLFTVSETGQELPIEVEWIDGTWTGSFNGQRYHAESRDGLLSLISKALNNNVRQLSEREKRECSIIVQTPGLGFYPGLALYISKKTGIPAEECLNDALLLDSSKAALWNEAIEYCWLAMNVGFSPDEDWSAFLARYSFGRHYSLGLLDAARQAYEKLRESAARDSILSSVTTEATQHEEPPTYNELDQLNDDELSGQFSAVKKQRARMIRAGTF